ncbi:ABC transporter ATP-binding protein [Streptomyces sp. Ru73]|uniref:ABC transporter ATP-binding protein n=1 Tax=Streptomyces sp. Ru73 TaxID=2080748 RepID=UPI0015E2F152|nr:ABC transporter ATP-binding protein [Streptomyces sp. Ru73]
MPAYACGRASTALSASPARAGSRHERLAELLADMVPGARTIRVSQCEPDRSWPSLYARAYDERGRPLSLNRAQRLTAARWVIRASPELDWDEPHDLDLASGALRPTVEEYASVAGGC